MYGILGEAKSDTNTLKVIVRKLANDKFLRVRCMSYGGSGELLKKGRRDLFELKQTFGCTKLIVCLDADGEDAPRKRQEVEKRVVPPSGLFASCCCIVIPVQEIEAWLLADINAVTKLFPSWKPTKVFPTPERIKDPKERLQKLSKDERGRILYDHVHDNERLADYLDLTRVRDRCPSFRPLYQFVTATAGGSDA